MASTGLQSAVNEARPTLTPKLEALLENMIREGAIIVKKELEAFFTAQGLTDEEEKQDVGIEVVASFLFKKLREGR